MISSQNFFRFPVIRIDSCLLMVNPMNQVMVELAAALRERLAIITEDTSRRDPEAHTARLRAVSEKIDNLAAVLPRPLDPQLAHFLQRKSYDKALNSIEQLISPSP
jgi:hypothetical protein